MPIKFRCPSCQQMLGIASRKAGKVVSCPRCSYPATVPPDAPEQDDETAALVEELAPPPAAKAKKPIFERRDFERVINGPARSGAAAEKPSGGVALLAAPEPGRALAPRAAAEIRGAEDARGMPTPLALGLAALAAAVGAGLGFMGGRMTAPKTAAAPAAATAAAAANVPAPAAPPPAYKLRGILQAKIAGKLKPDAGARIVLLPLKNTPLRPFAPTGLKPGDEGNADRAGPEGLERIGGAVATANEEGRYEVAVERPGDYWVVVVSSRAARSPQRGVMPDEDEILKKYIAGVDGLIGDRQFVVVRRAAKDVDGVKRLEDYKTTFEE